MTGFWETSALSVLQGIAEFLPISSSGHLVFGKSLFGMHELGLRLDVFLHLGTLLAVFAFYRKVIVRIVTRFEWKYMLKVVVSAVPVAAVGVIFRERLESAFFLPPAVGLALVFTGFVLIATKLLPKGTQEVSFVRAILMGLAQAVAILPGVSRSGMTLAAARAAKVDAEKSAEFSFLMSAPPIAGAALLELLDSLRAVDSASSPELSWPLTVYGCALAAVIGYFALMVLVRTLKSDRFWLFGVYCVIAGLTMPLLVFG